MRNSGRKIPAPAAFSKPALLFQLGERSIKGNAKNRAVPIGQRLLPGSTKKMRLQNIDVLRVYQRIFKAFAEERFRVMHKILVKRIVLSDKKTQRVADPPATTTCLLPGAGNTSRVADKHSGFQVTYINPQLQGRGGHH